MAKAEISSRRQKSPVAKVKFFAVKVKSFNAKAARVVGKAGNLILNETALREATGAQIEASRLQFEPLAH